ncbi:MAG: hypothetical protein I3265_00085 [Candidatus Moeniiplasma glomeromycotorum]|nr:hypothetical protein [Candidatus Moeniiplasma glomeromycotorum]
MFRKSRRKLTLRKKIILGGGILLVFLVGILTIVLVSQEKSSPVSSSKKPLTLTQTKNQVISEIQNLLNEKKVKPADLLNELKKQQLLKPESKDWKDCVNSKEVNDPVKLEALKEKVIIEVNELAGIPGPSGPGTPPGPSGPGTPPGPSGPGTPPGPSPTNKWEKVLWEVKNFLNTNPGSEQIEKWARDKEAEVSDLWNGINLNGADKSTLLSLNRGGGQSEIASKTGGQAETWKDFVSLSSAGDGNCFLNSFAVLLTGSQARDSTKETPGTQENVATRLRVALCLKIMKNYDRTELDDLKNFATNNLALYTDNCRYLPDILQRPVVMVHKGVVGNSDDNYINSVWHDLNKSWNKEPFFIYHVGSFHFEPLVRPVEHHQGEIYFNYSQVDFEDENNSSGQRSIVFTLSSGSLKKKGFSPSQNSRLDLAGFLSKNKIRLSYSDSDEKERFNSEKEMHEYPPGVKKTNENIFIRILKTDKISVSGNEIIFNRKSTEELYFRN